MWPTSRGGCDDVVEGGEVVEEASGGDWRAEARGKHGGNVGGGEREVTGLDEVEVCWNLKMEFGQH